jgi:hypothetical protein
MVPIFGLLLLETYYKDLSKYRFCTSLQCPDHSAAAGCKTRMPTRSAISLTMVLMPFAYISFPYNQGRTPPSHHTHLDGAAQPVLPQLSVVVD